MTQRGLGSARGHHALSCQQSHHQELKTGCHHQDNPYFSSSALLSPPRDPVPYDMRGTPIHDDHLALVGSRRSTPATPQSTDRPLRRTLALPCRVRPRPVAIYASRFVLHRAGVCPHLWQDRANRSCARLSFVPRSRQTRSHSMSATAFGVNAIESRRVVASRARGSAFETSRGSGDVGRKSRERRAQWFVEPARP